MVLWTYIVSEFNGPTGAWWRALLIVAFLMVMFSIGFEQGKQFAQMQ